MDKSPPPPSAPLLKLTRLDAAQKRALRTEIRRIVDAKEDLTVVALQRFAETTLAAQASAALIEGVLTGDAYMRTDGVAYETAPDGLPQPHAIWRLSPTGKPLTPAERTSLLDRRIRVLAEAYVADLMEDPQLDWASLQERAVEGTRVFANLLSAAVLSRAKFGAKTILPSCAEAGSLTFRSMAPRG